MANERRTAGAPSDLNFRYSWAGFSMGDPCSIRGINEDGWSIYSTVQLKPLNEFIKNLTYIFDSHEV